MESEKNVGKNERIVSLAGGGALMIYGLTRRSWGGALLALAGGALLHRGSTGHCMVNSALGKNNDHQRMGGKGQLSRSIPGHGGIMVEKSVTINKSAEEIYNFWRNFENLPRIMDHLSEVNVIDGTRSHWVATAPAGRHISWEAEIIRDHPNELIAWRSLPGSQVENSGSVLFHAAPEGRGTEVRVIFEYKPPAGAAGAAIAKLFGEEAHQQVEHDLRRFKQMMEAGELATTDGQPHG